MPGPEKYRITFSPVECSVDAASGLSVLDAARLAGINISSACGGKGTCGQCRVRIALGRVSAPSRQELEILSPEDIEGGFRLACCCFAQSDLNVEVPERSFENKMRLQLEGLSSPFNIDPLVRSFHARVNRPTLNDSSADLNRIITALNEQYGLKIDAADIGAVRQLPGILREHGFAATALVRNNEIIGFCGGEAVPLGVSIDLGTTKIAASLMDLSSGRELCSTGAVNPQSARGNDLMSRLDFAIHEKREPAQCCGKLTTCIREALARMINELTQKASVSAMSVADICVAGNSAMTHLFLDLPVGQLAASPYVSASNLPIDARARDLGLPSCPGAFVHVMPGIGGYVGSDHVAMIIGADIDKKGVTTLGVDIGTNTEIVIWRPDKSLLVSLSCPSGPAFEGAHVTDGMRASAGAIESVRLTESGVDYRTVDNARPVGLCGSGIIDVIAELYRCAIIDEKGRFDVRNSRVFSGRHGPEFRIVQDQGNGNGIAVSRKDIAEIQLAKAAIRAGIECLMEWSETSAEMVKEVIIAGAFGSYIDLSNTIDIGLLPFFENAVYRQVGNSALTGVKMALLSRGERIRSQRIAADAKYLELTTYSCFNRLFAANMRFPERAKGLSMKLTAEA